MRPVICFRINFSASFNRPRSMVEVGARPLAISAICCRNSMRNAKATSSPSWPTSRRSGFSPCGRSTRASPTSARAIAKGCPASPAACADSSASPRISIPSATTARHQSDTGSVFTTCCSVTSDALVGERVVLRLKIRVPAGQRGAILDEIVRIPLDAFFVELSRRIVVRAKNIEIALRQ